MIYEVRTYTTKVGALNEVLKRFEDAMPTRLKYSPLSAFFYSDFGRLNQIMHIWPYESLADREKLRGEAFNDPGWPPKVGEFLLDQHAEIFVPYDFIDALQPGTHGNFYEFRSYDIGIGGMSANGEAWAKAYPERGKRSPCVAAMYTEIGQLNKFVHVWPYDSLEQREEIRTQAQADGIWPPRGSGGPPIIQDVSIWRPAAFSPMN